MTDRTSPPGSLLRETLLRAIGQRINTEFALQVHCKRLGIECVPVGVWEIKRVATGAGGGKKAGKEQMIEAARHRWPHMQIIDDNAADALWLLEWYRRKVA